ncbi:ATP-grasp domain-containing protein [Actinomadura sp. DC4]|uniref:ATP-grasp domain-containing protein n=1 Tax=Actinomadura sp. DC4 TaxID=3055069 RepID=UPI0025AF5E86|nr:ATP-grasp domain-containing protein [Actinomadura sp. DC4]MDN3354829.1 ATP-grasp domain-containing protein [Actinomadura sp. DC4]
MTSTFVLFEMQGQQVLVAEEAKGRGFRTVALNHDALRTTGPFAVRDGIIDEYVHVASWSDEDAVRRLVRDVERDNDIAGVHAAFEPTQRYAIELRERLGLPHNTVEDTLHVLDKGWVRRRLHAEGLTRLGHATLSEALTWGAWPFAGPAVLKPANGTASVLCFIVGSLEELREAAATARAATIPNALMHDYVMARGEFVLEELARGDLLSVESLVSGGDVQHVGLTGRYLLAADPVVEQGLFFPYEHPRAAEIIEVCARFHRCLDIGEGATHIEVMVPETGPIELIDFNLRFAGIGAIALASDAFGVPFGGFLADLACGRRPDLSGLVRRGFAVDVAVMPPAGVTEFRDLTFAPGTTRHRVNKKIGGPLSGRNDQIDSVAWFSVTGVTAAEAHRKALSARAETIFNGAPMGDAPPLTCPPSLTAEPAVS